MEGNECYKFSTIKNFIAKTGQAEIKTILDIGVNTGEMTLMMNAYFPQAKIYGFEVVKEYFDIAHSRTKHINDIKLFNVAVSALHLFADDLGTQARAEKANLRIFKALPEMGPGWGGGSFAVPEDYERVALSERVFGYEKIEDKVSVISLDEFIRSQEIDEIDLIKIDCEGCEHSVFGCSDIDTLKRIRYIAGEYHGLKKFYQVMQAKLFLTHKVNLIGDSELGCFFAERLDGEKDGILRFDKSGMLSMRPWLCDIPIDWHLFDEEFVLTQDRRWHALPDV